jgi:hypothetical protein
MGREMLKRSATEAGLLSKGKIGDPGNAFFADIMRPAGPLYGPFLWHSSGNVRQDDATNDANTVGGAGLMTMAASSATPDAAMSNTSAAAAAAASASAKGNRNAPPIAVTKRTPSMTFLVSRQRELMERFQASTHHVRIHPQIDVARYNSNNNNNNATPPDVAIRQESMSKKLAKDERYIPVEILYPSAASLAMSRSNMIEANKKRKRQQELDELEKQELGGSSGFGGGANNNEEEEDDDDDNDEFEEPPEEQEEGEDYTTNYYDTEDESAGGDGNEATF